jgi:hypothetical protein
VKKLNEGGFWSTLSAKVGVAATLLSILGGGIGWAYSLKADKSDVDQLKYIISVFKEDFKEVKADLKELLKRK